MTQARRLLLRFLATAIILSLSLVGVPAAVRAEGAGTAPEAVLRCKGVLTFADALARSATIFVNLGRGQVYTPDCRKYADLARYCSGYLLDAADHYFQFGGAESRENVRFWADLVRPSEILPTTAVGPQVEAMRVLFLGRCEPESGARVR
jgi:hypothetical protein